MRNTSVIIFFALIGALCCCNPASSAGRAAAEFIPRSLPLPEVPDSLTDVHQRADYVTMHFWDAMDFAVTVMASDSGLVEQSMVDFINLLPATTDLSTRAAAVESLISQSAVNPDALALVASIADKYLYETESPFLNEDLYLLFLQPMSQLPALDQAAKLRIEDKMYQIDRNRPGSQAPDMLLNVARGDASSLSSLICGKPAILLLYDSDCDACKSTLRDMSSDSRLLDVLEQGKLRVVAVDLGQNESISHPELPGWYWTLTDDDVDEYYALRTLPGLYLIGADGNIILKDVSYDYLSRAVFHQ